MARIRTIKPEFFTDSKVLKVTPLARLFYVSLWCEADKQGRLKWDPQTLKYRYLPAEKASVEALGDELVKAKLIRLYEIDGQLYADVPGFVKHQVINNRESESSFPAYRDDACVTRESGVSDAARGKEGREGKEGTTPIVPKGTSDFEKFWEAYPEKVGKKAAERAWHKASDKPDLPIILRAIEAYKRSKPADRSYCNPATWLNGGRWNDLPASVVAFVTPTANPEEAQWSARIASWQKSRFWIAGQWGPSPDQPGCKAPKRLLAEHLPTARQTILGAG